MGRDKNKPASAPAPAQNLPAQTPISAEAQALAQELNGLDDLNADDQFKYARKFAAALGLSFKGHAPHGSNFSKRVSGQAVMQNVLDGMTPCALKTHLENEIFQATGWRPA